MGIACVTSQKQRAYLNVTTYTWQPYENVCLGGLNLCFIQMQHTVIILAFYSLFFQDMEMDSGGCDAVKHFRCVNLANFINLLE